MQNIRNLKKKFPARRILSDPIHLHSYARDAGFYRLLPQVVVKAHRVEDISTLFQFATRKKRKIVFRAGGTSLSGQAVSDDILVEIRQGWRKMEILDGGRAIRLEPGVIAAQANQQLVRYGTRIGPDPGSIRSACIGGIVANNASGIGSGIWANSYQTLRALEMVLPNGLILNTANPMDDEKFHHQAPEMYTGLLDLRTRIMKNPPLRKRIKEKYKLKNTVGYGLNSFVEFNRPIEILAHLMVGSEGTLGFISSVTLETVALQPYKATAFVRFDSLIHAAQVIPGLKRLGIYACEILDAAALAAVKSFWHDGSKSETIVSSEEAALLVEFQGNDQKKLDEQVQNACEVIQGKFPKLRVDFFQEPTSREKLWKVRRELGPIHASNRPQGTTVLSEDVCFHPKHLAKAIKDLQSLFKCYSYSDAVIFGHAGDGNLHFKLSLNLSTQRAKSTYAAFIEDLVTIVVDKYDGSLKAEHGTGRNMAPFVEREWGSEAYAIMRDLKQLIDPQGILNPDVIISSDPQIHLKNIKEIPRVDATVDACIECGLCEPNCPSADLTLTPRQRIMVLREMELLRSQGGGHAKHMAMHTAFQYEGIDTCAADGLCSIACPVSIDTGQLMKRLRSHNNGSLKRGFTRWTQNHPGFHQGMIRWGLTLMTPLRKLSVPGRFHQLNRHLTTVSGGRIPLWNHLLKAEKQLNQRFTNKEAADLVYFPSCINRIIHSGKALSVPEAFENILVQAGLQPTYPPRVGDLCCGLKYQSKGYPELALKSAIATTQALWESSAEGHLPIVMDTSPCTSHLHNYDKILSGIHLARWRSLKIVDIVAFLNDEVVGRLEFRQKSKARVVLHPTCSNIKDGSDEILLSLAQKCAETVIQPASGGCCGFAGDRGLHFPELAESASHAEAMNVKALAGEKHYSTSRTCEIGMSEATQKEYHSIVFLVHEVMAQQESFQKKF